MTNDTMIKLNQHTIPEWLHKEVSEYFKQIPREYNACKVLDIGANIGAFTVAAQERWPNADVICYEPMPMNVCQLRKNVGPGTVIVSAAVRKNCGVDFIYAGDSFVTSGFKQLGRQTDQRIMVECIGADELPACEVIKIDTEGCEVEILTNLDLSCAHYIMIEHHTVEDRQTIIDFLASEFDLIYDESGVAVGTLVFQHRCLISTPESFIDCTSGETTEEPKT